MEQLTVAELIVLLQEQPQDAKVNMCYDSDFAFTACRDLELADDGEVYLLSLQAGSKGSR